jgi:hypothetical protein
MVAADSSVTVADSGGSSSVTVADGGSESTVLR